MKWQQKPTSSLKNLQGTLLECHCPVSHLHQKAFWMGFPQVRPEFPSLSVEKSSFGKDSWRVSRYVFNLIHLSFLTGTPKVYFLWKDKLALFSLLTATDPVTHIQLPFSYLGQLLGDLWSSEILPHTFPVVLSDEKNWIGHWSSDSVGQVWINCLKGHILQMKQEYIPLSDESYTLCNGLLFPLGFSIYLRLWNAP